MTEQTINWAFEHDQPVKIVKTGEEGRIIGRTPFTDGTLKYKVRFKYISPVTGNDTYPEDWFEADHLVAVAA